MKNLLLIDDDTLLRGGIKDLLELKNYTVYETGSGEEGLKIALEKEIDLIICDIKMPRMDGYKVLKRINEDETLSQIPFIFLSGKRKMSELRYGMNLGADDYIIKPFSIEDLYTAIELRINKKEKIKNTALNIKQNKDKTAKETDEHLFITEGNKPQFIKINDIECITAFNEYTNVYICDSKKIVIRKSLREWESVLPDNMFIRIHRSTIINYEHVDRIEKFYARTYLVYLKNIKQPFVISQRYLTKLKKNLFF